jgi:hypothetical protein
MKEALPFYGQIWRKDDISFQTGGLREEIVQTHNVFTDNIGGVVNGMQLTRSSDNLTLYVSPGEFYSAGQLSEVNNNGGGERCQLFSQQIFTTLPETAPFQGQPTYLLVYGKVVSSTTNPNPLSAGTLVTSRNINTGENIPTRSYTTAQIVVSNPIVRDNVNNINGVPLALVQINYSGTTKLSSGGTINFIDESVRKNYIIANTVDVYNNRLLDQGVVDQFVTNRMIASGSITGDKFADNSIVSQKISVWDGNTAYNSLLGSGIANQHLKDQTITVNKINYQQGLNGFQVRNRLYNSSFENLSGTSTPGADGPAKWDVSVTPNTFVDIVQTSADPQAALFGQAAVQIKGGDLSGVAQPVSISQVVEFGESLKGKPLSAFFWAKELSSTPSPSGNTGLQGKLEFLSGGAVQQTNIFTTVTPSGSSEYLQWASASGITYTGTTAVSTQVRFTIGGNFRQFYYIDGAFLGETNLIPNYDLNPSEYILIESISANLISGTIGHPQIAPQAIWNNNIMSITGGPSIGPGTYGIANDQIQPGAVTPDKLSGLIPSSKIDTTTLGLIPEGGIILWDRGAGYDPTDPTNVCPEGYGVVLGLQGMLPLGVNPDPTSDIQNPGVASNTIGGMNKTKALTGNVGANADNITSTENQAHTHNVDLAGHDVGGGHDTARVSPGTVATGGENQNHNHNFPVRLPFYTVNFCRKKP